MDNKTPRLLRADEISCRVQSVTDYGSAIILLYKDARTDMTILDETYGAMNWQRTHEVINENLFCNIDVWDDDKKSWVRKQDVGVESNTESEKGEASDSFKRSGTNWGIGRELYTAPKISLKLETDEIKTGTSGKQQTTFKFGLTVTHIAYNDKREITELVLKDKKGKIRFSLSVGKPLQADEPEGMPVAPIAKPVEKPVEHKSATRTERVNGLCKEHGITLDTFSGMLMSLKQSGEVADKTTAQMTESEFGVMLSLVHTALVRLKKTA